MRDSSARTGAPYTEVGVMWQSIIHVIFIFSALGIAGVERLSQPVYVHGRHR